ncbi:MAG: type I pullulanase [Oscillospiraceae bacterium]|nr:type I pullulanase [Oscillospiraceae bacterium]
MSDLYSTEDFERKYTYLGPDLGARWSKDSTAFRLWAPTAKSVTVCLYRSGDPDAQDAVGRIPMKRAVAGTWTTDADGDLNGVYYTYLVELEDRVNEVCDPYAVTTGVNGQRAMVLDLSSTDPQDWDHDAPPHAGLPATDAVIYELHIRDLSTDPASGIVNKGKFLGLTETGTATPDGIPTGLDHIKGLGITHLHLLPSYDYGSVDETKLDVPQFNWGYDPVNFNVPEGSYATDPYHGEVRVKEMKQMIKTLHENGISVVMDVVYNHVYEAKDFCFNRIVPDYFSRTKSGAYSNGSGCGNDTASERSMVRKYIVDSVKYWADEYHIDGFRFDLVGLLDVQTINEIVATVHQSHPDVIFYGEGWTMPTDLTKPDVLMATQTNSHLTPGFAYFSDTLRDLLRGYVFDDHARGYIAGEPADPNLVAKCFMGCPDWCPEPSQTVNYASCHDNMSLFDRLTVSTPEDTVADRIRMNCLSAAMVMTSQGIPFFQAGEELLRSKPRGDGSFEHNSYRSPDSLNQIKWNDLSRPEYAKVADYYRGLIALRKAHPTLRLPTADQVRQQVFPLAGLPANVTGFHLRGSVDDSAQGLIVLFNPNRTAAAVSLPQGKWNVVVNADFAGTAPLAIAEGSVEVAPISAMVLTLEPLTVGTDDKNNRIPLLLGGIAAAAAAIGGTVAYLNRKKKKDN